MISVDYQPLVTVPWYFIAVGNAKRVGRRTGRLLLFMMDNVQLSASDVHVIGWLGSSVPNSYTFFQICTFFKSSDIFERNV